MIIFKSIYSNINIIYFLFWNGYFMLKFHFKVAVYTNGFFSCPTGRYFYWDLILIFWSIMSWAISSPMDNFTFGTLCIQDSCYSLIGGSDYKLIYRHYATLYFVFCVDSSESELGILDLIQVIILLDYHFSKFLTHSNNNKGASSSPNSNYYFNTNHLPFLC